MNAADLIERVERHYAATQEPLLLSTFGQELRRAGLWPIAGETRPLFEVLQATAPTLSLVRDPQSKAHVIVVPQDRVHLAEAAIEHNHHIRFLKSLPRSLLLAFCVKVPAGVTVHVQSAPPYKYTLSSASDVQDYVTVENEFRSPGVFLEGLDLGHETARKLVEGVRAWAYRHNVPLSAHAKAEGPVAERAAPPVETSKNALERLYAAQAHGMAEKLIVPLDIALILSRLP